MQEKNDQFYTALPVNSLPLSELLRKQELFYKVPADWHVIITDIKSSTAAVKSGLHENINLTATGSIVSLLNLAFKEDIAVPFFFGGDGATFIVPSSLVAKVMPVLLLFKERTMANFNLELRIGNIAVQKIYEQGYALNICKLSFSELFPIPIVTGNGLQYAETVIKGDDYLQAVHPMHDEEPDLTGMQCRWDRIPHPDNTEEVITLLVMAREGQVQQDVLSDVMKRIDEIYGSPRKRQPISVGKLKLKTTFTRMRKEMKTSLGKIKYFNLLYDWLVSLAGRLYFTTRKGKEYLKQLVEMSDTLVIDGKINTVMSGTVKQRESLQDVLSEMESEGKIFYGLHLSNSSIMSCYVRDMKDCHIHFVDGSEGGYTQAAAMLKKKLRKF